MDARSPFARQLAVRSGKLGLTGPVRANKLGLRPFST